MITMVTELLISMFRTTRPAIPSVANEKLINDLIAHAIED